MQLPKGKVHYRTAPPGGEKRCGNCSMFRGDSNSCTLVAGRIEPSGLCDRWDQKRRPVMTQDVPK